MSYKSIDMNILRWAKNDNNKNKLHFHFHLFQMNREYNVLVRSSQILANMRLKLFSDTYKPGNKGNITTNTLPPKLHVHSHKIDLDFDFSRLFRHFLFQTMYVLLSRYQEFRTFSVGCTVDDLFVYSSTKKYRKINCRA